MPRLYGRGEPIFRIPILRITELRSRQGLQGGVVAYRYRQLDVVRLIRPVIGCPSIDVMIGHAIAQQIFVDESDIAIRLAAQSRFMNLPPTPDPSSQHIQDWHAH